MYRTRISNGHPFSTLALYGKTAKSFNLSYHSKNHPNQILCDVQTQCHSYLPVDDIVVSLFLCLFVFGFWSGQSGERWAGVVSGWPVAASVLLPLGGQTAHSEVKILRPPMSQLSCLPLILGLMYCIANAISIKWYILSIRIYQLSPAKIHRIIRVTKSLIYICILYL